MTACSAASVFFGHVSRRTSRWRSRSRTNSTNRTRVSRAFTRSAVVRRRVGIPAGAAARSGTGRESASGGRDEQPCATRFSSERYPRSWRSGEHAGGSRTSSIHSTARCFARRICLEANENRRVRFESPPNLPAPPTRTPRTRWTMTSSPCGRGAGRRPSGSSARKPREVRRFQVSPRGERPAFFVVPSSSSSLFPSATRSAFAADRRARLFLTHSFQPSQSCTTSARSRPTGTARAGARTPRFFSAETSC